MADDQDFKRRPIQNEDAIRDLSNEFLNKAKDNPGEILLNEKFASLTKLTDEKIVSKCKHQIDELNKYAKIESNQNGQVNFVKFQGKEKEADEALANLDACRIPYVVTYLEFNNLNAFAQRMLIKQLDYCFDDCDRDQPGEFKTCYRRCFDIAFKYTHPSMVDTLKSSLDISIDLMTKL
jgi:hypothetical protein